MWPIKNIKAYRRFMRMKQDPVYGALLLMLGGNPVWTPKDIARLTEAGYQNCCTVYACVNLIVNSAAGIGWQLFKKPTTPQGKTEKIEEHDLLNLIIRPNPRDGGSAFTKNVLGYYLISGNSYLVRVGPEAGPPKELYAVRPDRIKILPGTKTEPIRGYKYDVGSSSQVFNYSQVLHLKTFHPLNDWYGLSPIEVAAKEIDIMNMARTWNMKLLQNDCRPPGALRMEGNLNDEQRAELNKQLREKYLGYENVAMPLILEGGLDWKQFAITPKDMDHLNSDKMTTRKICSVFNVAPELIGDAENKTYSNYQEARKALYLETVMPLLDYQRDEYNNWLTPAFGDNLRLDYNKDDIEAIREEMKAMYDRMMGAWWLTINERRVACGYDDTGKAGDVILVPSTMIPLSDISGNIEEE